MLDALMRDAAAAFGAGDAGRAEPLFRRIVAINPRDARAWHALALIASQDGRADEAFRCAEQAHRLDRRNPLYLNMIGAACAERGLLEESLRWFQRALRERPGDAQTHYNVAKALSKLERYDAAAQAYRRALQIDPSLADAANNLASLLMRAGRFDEAEQMLDRARAVMPDDETVATNTSTVRLARHGPSAAIEYLQAFVERHPGAAQARFELGLRLLADGRFAHGWQEFSWRSRIPGTIPPPGLVDALPARVDGRTVVLVPQQGLGDQLFFLRFAPLLRARGARVLFACPDKMVGMLRGAEGVDGIVEVDAGELPELVDTPLAAVTDLPLLLGADTASPPFRIPLASERIELWRRRLLDFGPPPYLGVTWRAGTSNHAKSEFAPAGLAALYKEIGIEALARALRPWPGSFLILQRSPRPREIDCFSRAAGRKAHDLSRLNERLEDMAAVLGLMEEYVGVSNTNMHIRAGVGKPARVLVPFPPEYRWMHAGQGSPWFPDFRVYRQPASLDWTQTLERLCADLAARDAAGTPAEP